tara:strand:- start:261 stop:1406 length:1146 start_codon:yes stop_codon:yes gene_type:complete
MKNLILNAPFNNLSFGNISVNLARELYNKGFACSIFPIGGQVDLSAFDKLSDPFKKWLEDSMHDRLVKINRDTPTLQMWHINGSETRYSKQKILYSFYEVNAPTPTEKNLVSLQDHCVFSSKYAADSFKSLGCTNVSHVGPGFDPDFHLTQKTYLANKIHFGLMGKFEKRKHTAQILKTWAKKYGNNYKYQLSCCITNPFFQPGQLDGLIHQALEGKRYGNINFLPFLKTNSEVNDYINAIDIELSGLSGAEGWNLPAFNATALGKWSIVLNATSHVDWATPENSILINASGQTEAYDGAFFTKGHPFNQGNIYTLDEENLIGAMELAETRCGQQNSAGLKLPDQFSYSKTVDHLITLVKAAGVCSHSPRQKDAARDTVTH